MEGFDKDKINLEDSNYSKNYSDDDFWNKLKKFAKKAGFKVICYAVALFYVLKSGNVDLKTKGMILGALGYFILPLDLIPDFIPVAGFTDDAGALMMAFKFVKDKVDSDIIDKVYNTLQNWFGVDKSEIEDLLKQ
ncbi:MAG: DUF1232 domain-containing protein [Fusobacteriaceae bacterium]|jgi:uncharacterized membrane protein YkvA (DUF1232 family)|nr:DUF1232 domain-containing protein [Fusobacteriaceae bacterium]